MAAILRGEPYSVPDPLADAWDDMVRRNRLLQAKNDPFLGDRQGWIGSSDAGVSDLLNQAEMPIADWQRLRAQQLTGAQKEQMAHATSGDGRFSAAYGQDSLMGGAGDDALAAQPTRQKLTGRPGRAAEVAGIVNAITESPNTRRTLPTKVGSFDISRGAGQQVDAHGQVKIPKAPSFLPSPTVSVTGRLDPAGGGGDVSISGVTGSVSAGRFDTFPKRVRIFNTPTGELDYEIHPGIQFSLPNPFTGKRISLPGLSEGTYVIGAPDPPRKK